VPVGNKIAGLVHITGSTHFPCFVLIIFLFATRQAVINFPVQSISYLIFNEWWTTVKGKTTRKGEYSLPGFYGKYKVTANGETKMVDLNKANGKVVLEF